MMLARHGIIMTVGIYANATGDSPCAELQKTVYQTLTHQPHVLQVHGFYYDETRRRVSLDVVPDLSVTDDQAFIQTLRAALAETLPDRDFLIVIDHNYSD